MKIVIGRIPISKASEKVGVPASTIRFWSDTFPSFVRPERSGQKNNRLYSEKDIDVLLKIKYYTEQGFSLDAIRKRLENVETSTDDVVTQLVEIRNALNNLLKADENS